jgi:hypothetical protein
MHLERFVQEKRCEVFDRLVGKCGGEDFADFAVFFTFGGHNPVAEGA